VTSGSASAMVKEQMAARRIEFMNATANPIDAQIMGMEGRKYLLEETAKSIQLDMSRVFPPASTPPPQEAGSNDQSEKPQALDAAGSPVVGQDTRTANIPSNVPPGTQSRAEGGPVAPGQPYLVGDAPGGKPELFVPDQPGVIVPNANVKSYDFEKDLYDYPSATSAGLKPDKTGHWQSRVPGGPHEGLILKHETHPTFWMTEQGEKQAGMNMYRSLENGRIYSFPADWSIPDGYVPYGSNNTTPRIEGRAKGGPVEAGTPYVVGEEGPEVVVPRLSGTVIPRSDLDTRLQGYENHPYAGEYQKVMDVFPKNNWEGGITQANTPDINIVRTTESGSPGNTNAKTGKIQIRPSGTASESGYVLGHELAHNVAPPLGSLGGKNRIDAQWREEVFSNLVGDGIQLGWINSDNYASERSRIFDYVKGLSDEAVPGHINAMGKKYVNVFKGTQTWSNKKKQ